MQEKLAYMGTHLKKRKNRIYNFLKNKVNKIVNKTFTYDYQGNKIRVKDPNEVASRKTKIYVEPEYKPSTE